MAGLFRVQSPPGELKKRVPIIVSMYLRKNKGFPPFSIDLVQWKVRLLFIFLNKRSNGFIMQVYFQSLLWSYLPRVPTILTTCVYVCIRQMLLYKVIHVAFKVNIFISSEGMWLNEMKTKFVKEGRKLKWRAKRGCSCAMCWYGEVEGIGWSGPGY